MQQQQSWADLEAFLNVQGFQEAERIYDACDLDYAPADKKQKFNQTSPSFESLIVIQLIEMKFMR